MVDEASSIETIKVNSELEALLLESKLIHKFQPKYNSVAKDDKNPLYITITKDEFPRVITTRREGTFGPFPSSNNVRSVLRMIRRIFPYSDHKIGKRACLYSQIGLCKPCPNRILGEKDTRILGKKYRNNIKNIKAVLSGRIKSVQRNLEKEMKKLSEEERFEEALEIKDKIQRLQYITQLRTPTESFLENPNLYEDLRKEELKSLSGITGIKKLERIECYDISHLSGTNAAASMVVFTNGEADKSEYRHFRIRQAKTQSDYDSIREIARRRAKNNWPIPDLIIIDGGVGQVKAFSSEIPVVGIAKNPDRLIIGDQKIRLTEPALNLVQRLRDEAHRFARRYHHTLVLKSLAHENN